MQWTAAWAGSRKACRALGLPRSGYYRVNTPTKSGSKMGSRIVALSRKHPRYGYRRITALLRREGRCINPKRVARVRRAEGLQVRKRQRRCRRLGPCAPQRLSATRRNQVWSWDFVADQTEAGSAFRILTLIDEHTRQCLAAHVGWSISAQDVLVVLEKAMCGHGTPEHIRSDDGPEFVAYAIQDWMEQNKVKTLYITPGSPWENGHIESFHDKLRDECLGEWRREYNEDRPHSSLGYQTPAEVAARCQTPLRAPPFAAFDSVAKHP